MGKRLIGWGAAGFALTFLLGAALHYTYDWSGGSRLVGAFSAVNESVWEHMKLLYVPLFAFTVVQFCAQGRDRPGFLAARAISALAGLLAIPALYYTYTGALGRDLPWADVTIFALAVALTFLLDGRLQRRNEFTRPWQQAVGLVILWGLLLAFVLFTFRPPQFPIWQDPVTLQYGISQPPHSALCAQMRAALLCPPGVFCLLRTSS